MMGDCLVYYPGTVYSPDNSKTFISACVANGEGETLMEQIPYLSSSDKKILQLSSDPSWLYRGRSNVVILSFLVTIFLLENINCLPEDMILLMIMVGEILF